MNLNTLALEYALEIEKCNSISRAAQNLYLSQPNLSTAVKNLEKALGFSIFIRSNSGVTTTQEGRLFLKSAKIMVSELENIRKIPSLCRPDTNNLSIVCVYSAFILDSFMDFREKNIARNTHDSFKETGLIHAMKDMISKDYRIGFFYDFDSKIHKRWELAQKYYMDINLLAADVPVIAILSRQHPLAESTQLSVRALNDHPLVTYEDFEEDDWLGAMGIRAHQDVLYIFDRGGMMEIVGRGKYIGINIGYPAGDLKSKDLVALPITGICNQLNQYWMKGVSHTLSERETAFLQFVKHRADTVTVRTAPSKES